MAAQAPSSIRLRAKTKQVVSYHYDESLPGRPLLLLIPGGLLALATYGLLILLAAMTWLNGSIDQGTGLGLMVVVLPVYIGGVYLFCYGYELYDTSKAVRDTAIIVFITIGFVVIIAVLFVAIAAMGKGSKGAVGEVAKGVFTSSSSPSRVPSGGIGSGGGGWVGRGAGNWVGPLIINAGPGTNTVTHEVVREVPVGPPAPQAIACPNCGRSYVPAENHFACPNCGAPTPPQFMTLPGDGSTGASPAARSSA